MDRRRANGDSAPIPRIVLLLGAMIPLAAAVGGIARMGKNALDDTYMRRDSFEIRHQRDSLNVGAELRAINVSLDQLLRACQRRRECL